MDNVNYIISGNSLMIEDNTEYLNIEIVPGFRPESLADIRTVAIVRRTGFADFSDSIIDRRYFFPSLFGQIEITLLTIPTQAFIERETTISYSNYDNVLFYSTSGEYSEGSVVNGVITGASEVNLNTFDLNSSFPNYRETVYLDFDASLTYVKSNENILNELVVASQDIYYNKEIKDNLRCKELLYMIINNKTNIFNNICHECI